MRPIRRSERSRVLAGTFVASIAIVSGCTANPETAITEAPAPSVAVAQSVASTTLEVDHSRVMFVDVRSGSVTPMPPSLTAFDEASDYRLSPDGSRFVFGAAVEDGSTHQLFLGSANGSTVRQLTDEPLAATGGRWSPDGARIVFLSGGFLTSRLKVLDVVTGDAERVRGVPRGVWEPSFSPDGRTILFSMATATPRGGWRVDLWTVPEGGGIRTRLIRHGGYAAYAPDGSTIAYHRTSPQPSAFCRKCWWIEDALSIADADGREELGMSRGGMIAPPQAHLMSGARWSPDGSMLMYTEVVAITGRAEIVVRDLRTGETTRVGRGVWPTWFDDRTLIVPDLAGSS